MKAGQLRHRITIQQPVDTPDAEGIMTQTWTTFAEVWASVEPFSVGSREYYQIASYIAEVSTKIKIRYLVGVAPYMRVVFGRKEYDILMVIDAAERHQELELMCREVVAGG